MTDRLCVFDLDGTLVDTAPDLFGTANALLEAEGLAPIEPDTLRTFIGMGARIMMERALKSHGRDPSPAELDAVRDAFVARYATRLADLSRPFPEMLAALETLEAAGVASAICTNKYEGLARELLDALGLSSRFVAVTGGDTFAFSKPDPRHLLETIRLSGGDPARTVYVGDSRVDFETAVAAEIPMVGITYGYSDVAMEELGPTRLCRPGEDVGAAALALLPPAA